MATRSRATAAEQLVGLKLDGQWTVTKRRHRPPGATGGNFSVGYEALDESGKEVFVKAIDFERVLQMHGPGVDVPRAIQAMTEAFNFERDILKACRDLRLSRVVTAIADGMIEISGFEPLHQVYYLVFERADGDARAHLDSSGALEVIWRLRMLQNVATALRQLHWNGIAHQDGKPSNVFEFKASGSRLGDFGRASRRGVTAPHDACDVAGDKGYAPPELLYGAVPADWTIRRVGCDAFLLGSLTYFFFTRTSITAATASKLHPGHWYPKWTGTFAEILPFLRQAFDEVIADFSALANSVLGPKLAPDLVSIVRELCEPDPDLRGHRGGALTGTARFGMDRYITRFDVLAQRASVEGFK